MCVSHGSSFALFYIEEASSAACVNCHAWVSAYKVGLSTTMVLQGFLTKDAGQSDNLEISKGLAAFPDPQLVGPGHAAVHRPFREGLHRAVCPIASQL